MRVSGLPNIKKIIRRLRETHQTEVLAATSLRTFYCCTYCGDIVRDMRGIDNLNITDIVIPYRLSQN